MSPNLYPVRVFFEGYRGCVKVPGFFEDIAKPPTIPGLPKLSSIDYTPSLGCKYVQPWMDARRDMYPDEEAALLSWLAGLQRRP